MTNFSHLLRTDAQTFANYAHFELHQSYLDEDTYIRVLSYDVEKIVAGAIRRYVVNLPPGFGKTFILGVTLPAWLLGHHPSARILVVSYGDDPAKTISRKIRSILRASWYRRAFPQTILAPDQQAASDFATTAGGAVYARSIDGATTGLHCDYLLVDDPLQIRDCGNLLRLESVNEQFDAALVSRLNNRRTGTIVIVHQRLHPSDLTGYLLKRRGWVHRLLPLIAPEDRDYVVKNGIWRREKGHVLRPSAYSQDDIDELRENTGAPGFGPLYQQTFSGPDVLQVRREDFVIQTFYAPPAVHFVLSIDPNHKGELGQSYGVIQCWGRLPDGKFLLWDQWRGRVHRSLFADHIRRMKSDYRPVAMLIEDNGPALDLQEQFQTPRCDVILRTPSGNKLARLRRHLDLFQNRQVVLRAGLPFMDELFAEFEQLPYGTSDDLVDTASQVFEWWRSTDLPPVASRPVALGALSSVRRAREKLYWNAGRPMGPYVFSRR